MKILFICTHNRCRSILSEAIFNHLSNGKITAFSAGSQPAGEVHPLSIKYLQERNISVTELKSQSWDEFESTKPDVVITVCDSAAQEACPVWFGDSITLHWGLPDPSKLKGSEEELKNAFYSVMDTIEKRLQAILSLELNALSQSELTTDLKKLIEAE